MARASTSVSRPRLRAVPARSDDARRAGRPHADADTLAQAQRGNVSAWARLYEATYSSVHRHVCCLTGDRELAEDLTQEAFAAAFASIGTFDARASFATWVRGIALNMVRMHWRRRESTARAHHTLTQMQDLAPPRPEEDPEHVHQQGARMQALYEVLAQISEHLREVFLLREIEGLPAREVGEMLGITANNVGVRANRAREKVRAGLAARGWLRRSRRGEGRDG